MSQGKEKKEASLTRLFKSGSGFPPDRFVLDTFVSVDIHSSTELIQCGRPCVESPPDYFSIMALGFSESWRNDRPLLDWLAPSLTHGGRKAESKGSFHKRCLLALFMSPGGTTQCCRHMYLPTCRPALRSVLDSSLPGWRRVTCHAVTWGDITWPCAFLTCVHVYLALSLSFQGVYLQMSRRPSLSPFFFVTCPPVCFFTAFLSLTPPKISS